MKESRQYMVRLLTSLVNWDLNRSVYPMQCSDTSECTINLSTGISDRPSVHPCELIEGELN